MSSVMTVQLLVKEWCVSLCSLCCSCCSTAKHSWIRPNDPWGFRPSLQSISLFFLHFSFLKGGDFKTEYWRTQACRVLNKVISAMTDSGGALIGILKSFWPCCHTVKVSPLRGMQSQLKGVRRTSTHKPLILRRLLLCHGGTFLTWQPQAARLSAFAKDVLPAGPLSLRGRGEGRTSMKLQTKGNHKTNCGCPLKCKDW